MPPIVSLLKQGLESLPCPYCSLCQVGATTRAKPWGHSLQCPLREKPHPADFMNCSHFPLSRLMAQLPTVSPSVVTANDFNPQHASSAFASENHSEQQDCFNSHLLLMMPFKCIKRISKYQTGASSTGDNSSWHWHAMQGQNSCGTWGLFLSLTVGNYFKTLENASLFPTVPQTVSQT